MTGQRSLVQQQVMDRYVAACEYPGVLDEDVVERNLRAYCEALGITREIVRLRRDWKLAEYPVLARHVRAVLDDFQKLQGNNVRQSTSVTANAANAALERFARWCVATAGYRWGWELSWMSTTYIGALQTRNKGVQRWSLPIYEAFCAGAWRVYWTNDTLYWIAKPETHTEASPNGTTRQMHRADGPALISDVEDLYFWHGVLVSEHIIMHPETLTVQEALAEQNADVRRVMFTRIGGERLSREMPTKVIECTPDVSGHPRKLYRIKGITDTLYIDLEDNAGQTHYARAVPPEVQTCDEAVAWRRGAIDYVNGRKRVNWTYAPQMEG